VPADPISLDGLPELITVNEAASVLRCSSSVVRGMLARRELEAQRVGRLVRIRRSSLERIVRGVAPAEHRLRVV
jgi:excisionase family DNA binding protein